MIGIGPKLRPDVSTAARWTAVGLEDQIRQDLVETGALIAPDGSWVVPPRTGTATHVSFSGAELSRVADTTMTHNHPCGTGPSIEDMVQAAKHQLRELRVVTAEYRFIAARLAGIAYQGLSAEYLGEEKRAEQTVQDEVRRGLLHPRDFQHELIHRTWLRVSQHLGFIYLRERS